MSMLSMEILNNKIITKNNNFNGISWCLGRLNKPSTGDCNLTLLTKTIDNDENKFKHSIRATRKLEAAMFCFFTFLENKN